MNWSVLDFVVFGLMLASAGGVLALAMLISKNPAYRAAMVLAGLAAFLLVWANLAVGIVGEPAEPANLLYFTALAIAPIGAAVVHFEAPGMARVMFTTAFSLVFAGLAALAVGYSTDAHHWLRGIVIGSGFFGALFAASGWLFLRATKTLPPPALPSHG